MSLDILLHPFRPLEQPTDLTAMDLDTLMPATAHTLTNHLSCRFPSPSLLLHPKPHPSSTYQLKYALPFIFLLTNVFLPDFVFSLAKNPCLRFCTLRDGLYVFRGADRPVEDEKGRVNGIIVV